MRQQSALLYSISDLTLYKELESLYRPDTGQAFAFLGSTFSDDRRWGLEETAAMLPTSRLLIRWVAMNEKTEREIIPALNSGKYRAVFINGFGREAYHFAIRFRSCPQTLGFHKGLVGSRILQQGGIAPTAYIARPPLEPHLIAADADYFSDPGQRMRYIGGTGLRGQVEETTDFLENDIPAQLQLRAAA